MVPLSPLSPLSLSSVWSDLTLLTRRKQRVLFISFISWEKAALEMTIRHFLPEWMWSESKIEYGTRDEIREGQTLSSYLSLWHQ